MTNLIDYEYNGKTRKIMPLTEMEKGVVYRGNCRNARYAYWTGTQFVHLRTKFGSTFIEGINHPENEYHFDVFLVEEKADETDPDVIELLDAIKDAHERDKEYYGI